MRKEIIDISDLVSTIGGGSEPSERLIGIADAGRLRGLLEQLLVEQSVVSARKTGSRIDIFVRNHTTSKLNRSWLEDSGAQVAFDATDATVSIPGLASDALSGWGRWAPTS